MAIEYINDPNWFWIVLERWTHNVEITAITREGNKLSIIIPVERFVDAMKKPKYRPMKEARSLYLDGHIDIAEFERMLEREMHGM
jgi:hypothetical protein